MEIIWRSTTEVAGNDDDDSKIAVIRVNNFMPNILARSLSLARSLALIRMQRSRERLRLRERASERAGERVLACSSLADSRIIRRSLRFRFICSRADNASGCVCLRLCLRLRLRLRVRVWIAPCGSFAIKTKLAPFAIPLRDSDLAVTFLIRKKSPKNFRKHHSKTFSDRQRWRTVACEVPQAKQRIKHY